MSVHEYNGYCRRNIVWWGLRSQIICIDSSRWPVYLRPKIGWELVKLVFRDMALAFHSWGFFPLHTLLWAQLQGQAPGLEGLVQFRVRSYLVYISARCKTQWRLPIMYIKTWDTNQLRASHFCINSNMLCSCLSSAAWSSFPRLWGDAKDTN